MVGVRHKTHNWLPGVPTELFTPVTWNEISMLVVPTQHAHFDLSILFT